VSTLDYPLNGIIEERIKPVFRLHFQPRDPRILTAGKIVAGIYGAAIGFV
jgi:hypothetical protein